MDTVLQGMSNVTCYFDDILITGSTHVDEHMHNQLEEEVLRQLEKHGVHLRRDKCRFMDPSVEHLGHQIDQDGLYATHSNSKPFPRHLHHGMCKNSVCSWDSSTIMDVLFPIWFR